MPSPIFQTALAAVLCLAITAGASPDITREGVGARRAQLDTMELSPFDQGLWSGLTDWRIAEPIDSEATSGKVVLIYTFSGYLPTAVRPIPIVNRIAKQYGDQGLIVVGIHGDEAYEDGVEIAERRRVEFPIARDAGGAFHKALHVDQDPDFYVIDRSGRLRFADIETASLERAVSMLIAESAGDAESLLDRMADADKVAAEEARRSARLRSRINLSDLPWVGFMPPSPTEYEEAEWPKIKTNKNARSRRGRQNSSAGPVKVDLNADLDWQPNKPINTDGRVVLIYLYTDKVLEELNRYGVTPVDLFGGMDQIQAAHPRDLLVIGAMIPATVDNRRGRRPGADDETKKRLEKAEKIYQTLTENLPVNHLRVNDYGGTFIYSKITPNNGTSGRSSSRNKTFTYPYHILVSSDGTIRWHGSVTSTIERAAEWEAALKAILAVDPGVKARREAERAFIKSKTE